MRQPRYFLLAMAPLPSIRRRVTLSTMITTKFQDIAVKLPELPDAVAELD